MSIENRFDAVIPSGAAVQAEGGISQRTDSWLRDPSPRGKARGFGMTQIRPAEASRANERSGGTSSALR